MNKLIVFAIIAISAFHIHSRTISLNDGWQFRQEGTVDWTLINIPHTWNTDAYTSKDYTKGKGHYRRYLSLSPEDSTRNYYIRFEGVSKSAYIKINGKYAGHHEGGYTSFVIPVSEHISFIQPNIIEIEVDNDRDDIPPYSGDFTFFGGIYRDVWLEDYDNLHFSLNHLASPGVKVTPSLDFGLGSFNIDMSVSNDGKRKEEATLRISLYNPQGELLDSKDKKIKAEAGAVIKLEHDFNYVINPQLWSPENPSLYRVEACLIDRKGRLIDRTSVNSGLRECHFDSAGRFFLNGKPLKLRGICRHQDMKPLGTALSDETHRRDMLIAKDMGANFIRISHYPQDPAILEAADRYGMLVWEEIPVIDIVPDNPAYARNAEFNLREMIAQHYNHPSVIMWGYMNEILLKARRENPSDSTFAPVLDRTLKLIARLENITRLSDPTRFTTMAFHGSDEYRKTGIAGVPYINGWNLYQGWYGGNLSGFERFLSNEHKENPEKPIIVSEYGAGSDRRIHSLNPEPFDFSTEYQQKYLEHYMRVIEDSDFVAGATHWNLIDFASALREESMPRINNKGLLYSDREPKDVYHFFKASWRDDIDYVYIASRDWHSRTAVSDSASVSMPIKIYANTPSVSLLVNGLSLGVKDVENHTAVFNAPLKAGANNIIARGGNTIDAFSVDLDIIPLSLSVSNIEGREIAVNVGSNCSYISPISGLTWVEDREYTPGSWGRIGGTRRNITYEINGTEDIPLFQSMAEGIDEYRFDVPSGEYEIEMGFADPSGAPDSPAYLLGRSSYENGNAIKFGIEINGNDVLPEYSPSLLNGGRFASVKKYIITSDDSIRIKFNPISGKPILNTIKIRKL